MQPKDTPEESALSRRAFVSKLAVGAAGAAVVTAVTAGTAAALSKTTDASESLRPTDTAAPALASAAEGRPEPVASTPAPWGLLHPMALGAEAANGWRVAGLTDIVDGSCVLTLENARGRTQRVHICRNDGTPRGLVYTKQIDLVVMNGGQGDLPTEESMGQAVAAIAHAVADNEGSARQAAVLAAMLPHSERVERFASAAKLR